MEENLIQKSIKCALQKKWSEAIEINQKLLESEPDNTDTLNRLARAFFEIGKISKAKSISLKVLEIDSTNNIALNSLERYKQGKQKTSHEALGDNSNHNFIEEPGKTKLTCLVNLGQDSICSTLNAGDEVMLTPHTHKVSVMTKNGKYIGKLTDDLSARLRQLIKGGNEYTVVIKHSKKNLVKIFIKEIKKGKDMQNVQSFPKESSESIGEFNS